MLALDHSPTNARLGAGTILIVEDEPKLRKVMADVLRHAGLTVEEAADGQQALEYLRGGGPLPDLVLLDLGMPVMDGWWCFRSMKTDPSLARIPVTVVSAADEDAVPASAGGHLRKPFQVAELLAVVQANLARDKRA